MWRVLLTVTLRATSSASHWEFSPCGKAVLHGKQRGRCAGRDPDLGVGVLHVAVCGLGRDAESAPDLFGLQAPREKSDNLGLALGQPRRPRDAGGAVACRL
jgi:hypothetical protein